MILILLKTFLWIAFIVGLVIFIHELGHFIAAKIFKVKVEEFAFGFGKKIFSRKIGETLYRINFIPYGGYVKLLGEEEELDHPKSFSKKSFLAKFIIILSGVTMNFFLAIVIFSLYLFLSNYTVIIPRVTEEDNYRFLGCVYDLQDKPGVYKVSEGTPAAEANFPEKVFLWSLDGEDIKSTDHFTKMLEKNLDKEITIKVFTFDGEWKDIKVTPRQTDEEGVYLGIVFYDVVYPIYKLDYSRNKLLSGMLHTTNILGYTVDIFADLVLTSFREKTVKPVSENTVGVIGVANTIFDLVKIGNLMEIINLIAIVNISLTIVNLFTIPGIDGGYIKT